MKGRARVEYLPQIRKFPILNEARIRIQGVVGEQAERVTHAGFLGRRPSGQTEPGGLGHRGERFLREPENIHLAGPDRVAEIDCRCTPNECHQILCSREMGRCEGFRFVKCSPGWP